MLASRTAYPQEASEILGLVQHRREDKQEGSWLNLWGPWHLFGRQDCLIRILLTQRIFALLQQP